MQRTTLLTAFCAVMFCLSSLVSAQDERPDKLSGFIKEGMHVGLKAYENNPSMDLTIFSESHYQTLLDAQSMTFDELKSRNAKVAQKAEEALKRFKESLPKRTAKLRENQTYAEPEVQISIPRLFYATIIHVGGDYILLKCDQGDDKDVRQAIAIDRISRIRWDSGELQFNVSSKIVQK